jgi:hypothetical protein
MEESLKLALYTTVYPAAKPYLRAWYDSVMGQTDRDFQLWIGVDGLEMAEIKEAAGSDVKAVYIGAALGDTPAQIRQRALSQIVETYDAVILVDSDDVLHTSRVASARQALRTSDLAGCALRLVDQKGSDLGLILRLPPQTSPEEVLPRNNIFGLSNSAFHTSLLRRCLPISTDVELVDWYLATRAWLWWARLSFDDVARMDYRQHDANMVRVTPPFSGKQIIYDTERVRQHFELLLTVSTKEYKADRLSELMRVKADIDTFHREIILQPRQLEFYVHDLNELDIAPVWWSWIAHPSLRQMWTR